MNAAQIGIQPLRLVNERTLADPRALPRRNTTAPADPRWVLAVAAARNLEGGRAAIRRPEARDRVTSLARSLGLRAFDSALVIAIVQDAAMRGEPLGGEVAGRLKMISRGSTPARQPGAGTLMAMAAAGAVVLFTALVALVQ
jgi:hypothetical protein